MQDFTFLISKLFPNLRFRGSEHHKFATFQPSKGKEKKNYQRELVMPKFQFQLN